MGLTCQCGTKATVDTGLLGLHPQTMEWIIHEGSVRWLKVHCKLPWMRELEFKLNQLCVHRSWS